MALHPKSVIVLICALPLAVRIALLPILPIPAPAIHDEFSNLLAADTFLHGRLTNPTPPCWEHFETFHELLRPTYSSVYPPGLGLLLAVSKAVFGDPWWGVLLSVGPMSFAIIWMLRPWLPPVWAALGGLLVGLQFGIVHNWVNGYWGGTLPAIGGALLIGAYGRLRRATEIRSALLFAAGTALLVITRPYEGGILFITTICALMWSPQSLCAARKTAAALGFSLAVIALPTVGFLAAQNKAVTGSMFVLPHELFRKQYGVIQTFVWQPRRDHTYRYAELRNFFYRWEPNLEDAKEWGTVKGALPALIGRLRASGQFVPHAIYFPIALVSMVAALFRRMRFFALCAATAIVSNGLVNWLTAHYFAPVLGALIGVHIYFLRYVRASWRHHKAGQYVFPMVILTLVVSFGIRFYTKTGVPADKVWASARQQILRGLSQSEQRNLIFVRYDARHDPVEEWVFNGADIPNEKVIWARYVSRDSDRAVAAAFPNRSLWFLEPDKTMQLVPYGAVYAKPDRVAACH